MMGEDRVRRISSWIGLRHLEEHITGQTHVSPQEEGAYLPEFQPKRAHLFLREVYGNLTHHNDVLHLDGGVPDNYMWQHNWRRLAAQLDRWYTTPPGAVGFWFTPILATEWWGVLYQNWNSEIPLVFAHVILTKTLVIRRAREISARITRSMDIWERGPQTGLAEDTEEEGVHERAEPPGENMSRTPWATRYIVW